jgi:hypothetical protein
MLINLKRRRAISANAALTDRMLKGRVAPNANSAIGETPSLIKIKRDSGRAAIIVQI